MTHIATIGFVVLLLVATVSSATARYEMRRADQFQTQINAAKNQIAQMGKETVENEKISKNYQDSLSKLHNSHSAKRVQPSTCFLLSNTTGSVSNGPTGNGQHVGQNATNGNSRVKKSSFGH